VRETAGSVSARLTRGNDERMKLESYFFVSLIAVLVAVGIALLLGREFLRRSSRVPPVPRGTAVNRDIAYVANGHPRQKLDLYLPKDAENPPLMILIHGGGFKEGDKREENAAEWLREGYAVASVNYRYSSDAVFPAQIEDCKTAVRWLRANAKKYGYDRDRFGARGSSAGGYLVTMLGTTGGTKKFDVGENPDVSSRVQAVADRYGPIDFLQMDAHRLPGAPVNNKPDSLLSELIGGKLEDNKDKAENANPINYIAKDCPPFIIVHGDSDLLVPHHQSELLAAALARVGVPVTLYTVKGGGHGGFDDPNAEAAVREFFARYLKPNGRGR
jgi:acetyl esterase/lipase